MFGRNRSRKQHFALGHGEATGDIQPGPVLAYWPGQEPKREITLGDDGPAYDPHAPAPKSSKYPIEVIHERDDDYR